MSRPVTHRFTLFQLRFVLAYGFLMIAVFAYLVGRLVVYHRSSVVCLAPTPCCGSESSSSIPKCITVRKARNDGCPVGQECYTFWDETVSSNMSSPFYDVCRSGKGVCSAPFYFGSHLVVFIMVAASVTACFKAIVCIVFFFVATPMVDPSEAALLASRASEAAL